jgi:transcriptional repressor NrdR
MFCPKCHYINTKVYDTRIAREGKAMRRRRMCPHCGYRFTNVEVAKVLDLYVQKRNGQVELFSEDKLDRGVRKAFNKRRVDNQKVEFLVQQVIEDIMVLGKSTVTSEQIGEIVLSILKRQDEAAFICFSAMFGNYSTRDDFNKILKQFSENTPV